MPQSAAAPTALLPTPYQAICQLPTAQKKPAPGLRIGDYLIGEDVCTNLFGHPDIRY